MQKYYFSFIKYNRSAKAVIKKEADLESGLNALGGGTHYQKKAKKVAS